MQVSLLELQQSFRHALIADDAKATAVVLPWVFAKGADAISRVAIYRNTSKTNLRNALSADYPVVEKLVGNDFFAHAANAYVATTPSVSGDIGDYGKSFADFLATFPAAASLPYLSDIARLERARVEVALSVEITASMAMNFSRLSEIFAEALGEIKFVFHPATRLLASTYPLMTIWESNQLGYEGEELLNLDLATGEFVLLCRPAVEVELKRLTEAEYAWLIALHSGSNLSDAVDSAFSVQQDFDLSDCLQRHIAEGTFISFTTGFSS